MAIFTVELGVLIASGFDLQLDHPESYPIYDEAYRATLNKYITDHFRFREIGQDTPELFKFYLLRKLREIMPLYNELYKSQLIEFNPLYSQDLSSSATTDVTRDGTMNEESTANSDNTATSRVLTSTTPQTQLIHGEDYASGLVDNTSEGLTESTGLADTTTHDTSLTEYTYRVAGYTGQNPSEAIMRFRQSLINVNMMVLSELEVLFMGVWGIGGSA